jgi:hypothetical protein
VGGTYKRGAYKQKDKNIEKLKIYLENERKLKL